MGILVSLLAALIVTPRAIRKLRGAGITGRDRHKPGRPQIPEMGGLAVFLAFNAGVFGVLGLGRIPPTEEALVLASLVVAAGACITGVLDDLVSLRQRFKAFIPFAFAAPLALYAPDTNIFFPGLGSIDFGLVYTLLLLPLGAACASNGFNMLEGFNGLGAGLGIILGTAMSGIILLGGSSPSGLVLLLPLIGALGGFLYYNAYPSKVFPGDTMTLLVGAVLASAAVLSKVEFWGALLFVPHVVEFFLKARAGFKAQSFATRIVGGRLVYEGPIRSLTHIAMRIQPVGEGQLVIRMWAFEAAYAGLVVFAFVNYRAGAFGRLLGA